MWWYLFVWTHPTFQSSFSAESAQEQQPKKQTNKTKTITFTPLRRASDYTVDVVGSSTTFEDDKTRQQWFSIGGGLKIVWGWCCPFHRGAKFLTRVTRVEEEQEKDKMDKLSTHRSLTSKHRPSEFCIILDYFHFKRSIFCRLLHKLMAPHYHRLSPPAHPKGLLKTVGGEALGFCLDSSQKDTAEYRQ